MSYIFKCDIFGSFQGNITTAVRLDREQAGAESYTLTVLAADDAIRSRQGTTQVNHDMKPFTFVLTFLDLRQTRLI